MKLNFDRVKVLCRDVKEPWHLFWSFARALVIKCDLICAMHARKQAHAMECNPASLSGIAYIFLDSLLKLNDP